jgi:hypothetical protein
MSNIIHAGKGNPTRLTIYFDGFSVAYESNHLEHTIYCMDTCQTHIPHVMKTQN